MDGQLRRWRSDLDWYLCGHSRGACCTLTPTHIDTAVGAGVEWSFRVYSRLPSGKVGLAIKVSLHPGTIAGVIALIVLIGRDADINARPVAIALGAATGLPGGRCGWFGGCIVALLFNDSGIVAAILLTISLMLPVLYSIFEAGTPPASFFGTPPETGGGGSLGDPTYGGSVVEVIMRFVALDIGDVRIGVATCDSLEIAASPAGTIQRVNSLKRDVATVAAMIVEQEAEGAVAGVPLSIDGSVGPQAEKVLGFIRALRRAVDLPIVTWDESLSSVEADDLMISRGLSRQKRRVMIDQMAAVLILEGYLAHRRSGEHAASTLGASGHESSARRLTTR